VKGAMGLFHTVGFLTVKPASNTPLSLMRCLRVAGWRVASGRSDEHLRPQLARMRNQ
jgi:hypothetical protein